MRRFWLFLLIPSFLWADIEPAKLLSTSTTPLVTAALLLDGGETAAVSAYAQSVAEKRPVLANQLISLSELWSGNTAGALQALENVEKPDAWTKAKKEFLAARFASEQGLTEVKSETFTLRLPRRDVLLAQTALPALDRAYMNASKVFGVSPSTPVLVEIHADAVSFSAASGLPIEAIERAGAVGAVRHGRILLLSPRTAPSGFRWLDVLTRQYNRLLLRRAGGSAIPGWVLEGTAKRYESLWRSETPDAPSRAEEDLLARAALVNPSTGTLLLPWSVLETFPASVKSQEEARLALLEASDAVATLIPTVKLPVLLSNLNRMGRAAALQELGSSERDLEDSWIKSLEGRTWNLSKGAISPMVSLKPLDELSLVPSDAQPLLRQADALRDKRQFQAALPLYRKITALAPDNGVSLTRQADALIALEDAAAAEPLLRQAMEKNPSYAPPFVSLGGLLYEDGRYDDAQKVLQEGLEINPFHARLYEYLGLIAVDVANIPAARQFITMSLDLDPSNADLRDILQKMPK
jgi:tetratricopeptide (TPR) repeat protein